MGFWSTLGKIGAGVAAPFTGGVSLAAIPAIDAIGAGMGAASQSMASNRGAKTAAMLDAQKQMEEILLARQTEQDRARNNAQKQSVMASLLANWQSPTHPRANVVRFGGPTGPSNAMNRMAGGEAFSQNMRRLLQPDLVNPTGMMSLDESRRKAIEGLPLNASFWEKLLGIGGAAATGFGALGKADAPNAFTPRNFYDLNPR